MGIFLAFRNFLQEPRLKSIDPNSDELLTVHLKVLNEKQMLRNVFAEFYQQCITLDKQYFGISKGARVEIGAGVSFFKKSFPEILSTDIKNANHLDLVVDAQQMPFEDKSIRAIYGINCFHHLPDPDKFFKELVRVLDNAGGCVLIEPFYGFAASRFYKKLFDSETFDPAQKFWKNETQGFMVGANQALSYIVFKRDKILFEKLYPNLEIVLQKPLNNYLRYLFSGGLNFRQVLPAFFSPFIFLIELLLYPINSVFALHQVIVIRKK